MIASLSMYARPELVVAHDALWSLIYRQLNNRGIAAPQTLSRQGDEWSVWQHPELVLSQTCGLPYRSELHETVALVGTPDFALEGCEPGYYRSAIVVKKDDKRAQLSEFREAVFAYNQKNSQSGYAAAWQHLLAENFWFTNTLQTGAHAASANAVADGQADIAALDAVSWRLFQRFESFTDRLRVLEWTAPTPGLPYITAPQNDAQLMFSAVAQAISELSQQHRRSLGIQGFVSIEKSAYMAVPIPPEF